MAKKITISSRKGGSGKTTTAVNLATSPLHKKGKKTLLVDLDPQANATISVGIDPLNLAKHINSLFTDIRIKTSEAITKTSLGKK